MTLSQELSSWNPFAAGPKVQSVPSVNSPAPSSRIQFPRADNKPTVIAFLRHCGCPFAEKTLARLRTDAEANPAIHFIAVSHSDEAATAKWLTAINGAGKVEVLVDDKREIFAPYGLGYSSMWAVLNPWSLVAALQLSNEGISVRPTESGSRWQSAGLFAVAADGTIKYARKAATSDDLGNFDEAVEAVRT